MARQLVWTHEAKRTSRNGRTWRIIATGVSGMWTLVERDATGTTVAMSQHATLRGCHQRAQRQANTKTEGTN